MEQDHALDVLSVRRDPIEFRSKRIFARCVPLVLGVNRPEFDPFFGGGIEPAIAVFDQFRSHIGRSRFGVLAAQVPFWDGGRIGGNGPSEDSVSGIQIAFHQNRRQAQDVSDIVKSVSNVIGGKFAGGVKVHADEISDRVFVFEPIEPSHRHTPCLRLGVSIGMIEDCLDVLDELFRFTDRRSRLLLGRHRSRLDLLHDVHPDFPLSKNRIGVRKTGQNQFGLRVLTRMALRAVLFDEGFAERFVIRRGILAIGRHCAVPENQQPRKNKSQAE